MSNNPFSILIGDYSIDELPLGEDIRMIKAALLYGDKAKLCTATSSMAITMLGAAEPKPRQKMDILRWIAPIIDEDKEEADALVQCCDFYTDLSKKKHFNRDELLFKLKFERNMEEIWGNMKETLTPIMEQLGGNGLYQAIDSKVFENSAFRKADSAKLCLSELIKQMTGGCMPMFKTADAVDGAVCELPILDMATIEEIVTIRDEIAAPLSSLKAAMSSCSRADIEAAVKEVQAALDANALVKEIRERQQLVEDSSLSLIIVPVSGYADQAAGVFGLEDTEALDEQEAYTDWKKQHSDESKTGVVFIYKIGTPVELPEDEETEEAKEAEPVGVE